MYSPFCHNKRAQLADGIPDKKMIVWPKPKKLAEQLVVSEVARVGNVKVFTSRVRPLDKERAIGRAGAQEDVMDHKYVGIDRPQRIFKGHVRWSR